MTVGPGTGNGLVSVIIPCYNHARFLGEAIESALAQTYAPVEIVVVDDGSTDDTAAVAARYPGVRLLRQANRGLSAARNAGLAATTGDFLVFLDADDRLLPDALAIGQARLAAHPDSAFVSGRFRTIALDGSAIGERGPHVDGDHYVEMLRRNYVGMHATVMYRRWVFDAVGGFDPALRSCEDYDHYLRVARRFPVSRHDEVVAEYRRYDDTMSRDFGWMLRTQLAVLRAQRPFVDGDPRYRTAYIAGLRHAREYYGLRLARQVLVDLKARRGRRAARGALLLARHHPGAIVDVASWMPGIVRRRLREKPRPAAAETAAKTAIVPTMAEERGVETITGGARSSAVAGWMLNRLRGAATIAWRWVPTRLRHRLRSTPFTPPVGAVRFGDLRRLTPIGRDFGLERGLPVDRYYVEDFLFRNAQDIRGRVLEIGDRAYTERFGGARVTTSDVLHVAEGNPEATFVGDLTRAEHLPSDAFDCVVLTQTLHLIYDVRAAIATIHRILKPGGVVLVTAPGISRIDPDEWGDTWYWGFTTHSARRLFAEQFGEINVAVEAHGNVLAAASFLYGLAAEELRRDELDHHDRWYEMLVTLRAVKPPAVS